MKSAGYRPSLAEVKRYVEYEMRQEVVHHITLERTMMGELRVVWMELYMPGYLYNRTVNRVERFVVVLDKLCLGDKSE